MNRGIATFVRTLLVSFVSTPLMTGAIAQTAVTVVEYYNRALDAYFITGRSNEQTILDGISDFQRTG